MKARRVRQTSIFTGLYRRIWPAVVDGLQRGMPSTGLQISIDGKNTWIPGNTVIKTPSYTLYRDSRAFHRSEEFVPERWTTQPELVLDASAYAPFSVGRFSCIGKRLAMIVMRHSNSSLVLWYEFESLSQSEQSAFERHVKRFFILAHPELEIR
jgi:cytochrome P450